MSNFRSILIAEDDPKDTELMRESMAELKLANELVFVRDGVEAVEYLEACELAADTDCRLPVLILLDIKMPRMNGIEVLNRLQANKRLKLIPVVMLTSSRESEDLQKCYDLGVNAYVVKPVRFAEFVDAVKQVGAFWGVLNEVPVL